MNVLTNLVIRHLPKYCKRHTPDIIAGIVSVDIGLKPSYLLDCCSVSPSAVNDLLRALRRLCIIKQCLTVLEIESEIFIVYAKSLQRHLRQLFNSGEIKLADVSPQLKCSEMLNSRDSANVIATHTEVLIDQLVAAGVDEVIKVNLSNDFNRTTIYGILLGYPTVYWYNSLPSDGGNCLSMVPLRLVTAVVTLDLMNSETIRPEKCCKLLKPVTVSQFSIPENLYDSCHELVVEWQAQLKRVSEAKPADCILHCVHFESRTIVQPVICL